MKASYLGPPTSFSYQFAKQYFANSEVTLKACDNFQQITDSLDSETLGVLPIENSSSSNVAQGIDLIIEGKLKILGEGFLSININLAGLHNSTLEGIKVLHAHPMAIKQCSRFIREKHLQTVEHSSNSAAQEAVMKLSSPQDAAVCGAELIDPNKLQIIKCDINNYKNNHTRFLIVSNQPNPANCGDKHTILFKAKHEPGSLAKALKAIADLGINLSKISSHQIPGTDWEYMFWIDLEIPANKLNDFTKSFAAAVQSYEVIGQYEKGKIFS